MGKLFVLMGKSATGKDTIFKDIMGSAGQFLNTVILYTTRPIRTGEREGVEYYFTTEEQMKQMEQQGKIIECRCYNTIYGKWYYFTANDGQINLFNQNYLMIATLEGYEKLRAFYGKENVIPIYIEVEAGIRLERAIKRERQQREPKYTELCRRFLADESDFSEENIKRLDITKRYNNLMAKQCAEEITADIMKNIRIMENLEM